MNQNDLNRAVAKATGETVETIKQMGFSPVFLPIPERRFHARRRGHARRRRALLQLMRRSA